MDTSAWLANDKSWMKQRREEWKKVKVRLDNLTHIYGKKSRIELIKHYYLTGEIPAEDHELETWGEYDPERPLIGISGSKSILLECWLSADQSEGNWNRIKRAYGKYTKGEGLSSAWHISRVEFMEVMDRALHSYASRGQFPHNGEEFFCGLEKCFYHFFYPTARCRPEDYPECEADFIGISETCRWQIETHARLYLNSAYPDIYHPVLDRLDELKDTLNFVEEIPVAAETIRCVDRINKYPDNYPSQFVEFSRQMMAIYMGDDLPEAIQKSVAEALEKKSSWEEEVIPGSRTSIYFSTKSRKLSELTEIHLTSDDDLNMEKLPRDGSSIFLRIRKSCSLFKTEGGLFTQFNMRVRGHEEVWWLASGAFELGFEGVYGFFHGHDTLNACYRMNGEKGKIEVIYKIGDDSELDKKIAEFEDPGQALSLVVGRSRTKDACSFI